MESPKQETLFNKSKIKIESNQAIVDTGTAGHFILSGAPLNNIKPSHRLLVIHLPDGKALQSTHKGSFYLPWITKASTHAHAVPGLTHTYLISINILCNASCKVSYDK